MSLALLVYGIAVMSNVIGLLIAIQVLSVIVIFASFVSYDVGNSGRPLPDRDKRWADLKKQVTRWITVIISCACVIAVIPSEKTAYIMVAAYATQQIAESPATAEISGKVITIINQQLDSYITQGVKK